MQCDSTTKKHEIILLIFFLRGFDELEKFNCAHEGYFPTTHFHFKGLYLYLAFLGHVVFLKSLGTIGTRCSCLAILSQRSFHTLEFNFFASYFLIIVVNVSLFLTGMCGSVGIGRWSSRGTLTVVGAGPSVPQWKYTGMCTRTEEKLQSSTKLIFSPENR